MTSGLWKEENEISVLVTEATKAVVSDWLVYYLLSEA